MRGNSTPNCSTMGFESFEFLEEMVTVRVLSLGVLLLCAKALRIDGPRPHDRPVRRRALCPARSSLVAGLVGLALVSGSSPALASDAQPPPEPSLQSSLDFIGAAPPSSAPTAAAPPSAGGPAPQPSSAASPTVSSDLARAIDAASRAGSSDPRSHGPALSTGEKS